MVRRTWKAPPAMFPLSEQRGKADFPQLLTNAFYSLYPTFL